jgi:hypothetical protein
MRSRSIAPVMLLTLVVTVATSATAGAPTVRLSGTVAAIDAEAAS